MNLPSPLVTLAIETATPYLALGLLTPRGEFCELREVGRAHAEQLPRALETLFAAAGLPKSAAQQIVIGTGPGSYTGVRVGASYALGLGRAIGAPVLGVGTLESLIDTGLDGEQAVSLDARKGQLYGAVYRVSGGNITQTLLPAARYAQADFAEQVGSSVWRQDPTPDALALAHAGRGRGAARWSLQYL